MEASVSVAVITTGALVNTTLRRKRNLCYELPQ
jgi:hypothetical protein